MARYVRTVTSTWSAERAFAYMSDFSNAVEWDPGVVAASRVDSGEIGRGSAFDLTVKVGSRTLPMRYEITDYSPVRVTFSSRTAHLASVDTVTVSEWGGRTEVTYDARLNFRGIARLADPLLRIRFRPIAERAGASLQGRLNTTD